MKCVLAFLAAVCEALGRCEHDWNNRYVGERSNEDIDRLPDCADCANAAMGYDEDMCPNSRKPCGHHCNHSWSHDLCCWCPAEWGEDGIRLDRMTPEKRSAYERAMATGDWSTYDAL